MSEQFTPWTYSEPVELTADAPENQPRRRRSELFERETKTICRRAFSETQLLDLFGFEPFKVGHSYHTLTAGDVDSLSFLKLILRHQELTYCLASTWCMNADDVLQFDQWLTDGKIKKLDFYVGEIFPGSYTVEYKMLRDVFDRHQCGRIAVFRNHAKVYAGYGDRFAFAIESSANIQTNPRTEQTAIHIDKGLYQFYKAYFDDITTFDKEQREKDKARRRNNGN